jgi:DNA invertase Pin-like site-specific DNA recombinase
VTTAHCAALNLLPRNNESSTGRYQAFAQACADRLGRSLRKRRLNKKRFAPCGIDLITLRESLDATRPLGKAIFGMVGVMAEFERELIRARHCRCAPRTFAWYTRRLASRSRRSIQVRALRRSIFGWREIASELGVLVGTLYKKLR